MNLNEIEEKENEIFSGEVVEVPAEEPMMDLSDLTMDLGFVPYDHQSSFVSMCDMVGDTPLSVAVPELVKLGYPPHFVRPYEKGVINGTLKGKVRRLEQVAANRTKPTRRISKARGVGGRELMLQPERGQRGVGTFWRIPKVNVPLISKPVSGSRDLVRKWILGEAYVLWNQLTHAKQFVTGNEATMALYYGRGSQQAVKFLLSQAAVFIDSYHYEPRTPNAIRLFHFMNVSFDSRYVVVSGESFTKPCPRLSELMGKNKSLLHCVESYLESGSFRGSPVDAPKLRSVLMDKFPPPVSAPAPLEPIPEGAPFVPLSRGYTESVMKPAKEDTRVRKPVWVPISRSSLYRESFMVLDRPFYLPFDVTPVTWHKPRQRLSHAKQAERFIEKTTYQGAAVSKNAAVEYGESVALQFAKKHEQTFARYVALFAALYVAPTWAARGASLMQFIAGDPTLYKMFKTPLVKIFYQGEDEKNKEPGMDSSSSNLEDSYIGQVWTAIIATVSAISIKAVFSESYEFFMKPLKDFINGELRLQFVRATAISISQSIIDAIKEVFRRIQSCVEQKSLSPLWGPEWDPITWGVFARGMISHQSIMCSIGETSSTNDDELKRLREEGKIPKWWTTPVMVDEFAANVNEHIGAGRRLAKYFSASPQVKAEILRLIALLDTMLTQIDVSRYAGGERMRPFFIVIHGLTGQGKTNLEAVFRRSIAQRKGYDSTASGTYTWLNNQNFQSGLNHQWAVKLDDPDHGVAPPTAGFPNHIETCCKLVNNNPSPIEEAEASKKGFTYARPLYVSYLTNFLDCRTKGNTLVPEAFWRRIDIHATVTIKPEYATDEGICDSSKMDLSDSHDMYRIEVRHYSRNVVPVGGGGKKDDATVPLVLYKVMELSEFMVYMHKKYDEHIAKELAMKARRGYNGAFCSVCYLPMNKDCGHSARIPPEVDLTNVEVDVYVEETLLQGATQSTAAPPMVLEEESEAEEANFEDFISTLPIAQRASEKIFSCCTRQNLQQSVDNSILRLRKEMRKVDARYVALLAAGAAALGTCVFLIVKAHEKYQGRENNASGETPANWVRAQQNFTPGMPQNPSYATYTKEQLLLAIRDSELVVVGAQYTTKGHCVAHNVVLAPTHVAAQSARLRFEWRGKSAEIEVSRFTQHVLACHPELSLFRVSELSGLATLGGYPFAEIDRGISQFDEVELWSSKLESTAKSHVIGVHNTGKSLKCVLDRPTIDGDCGYLYIARFGTAWRIVAMHYALLEKTGVFTSSSESIGAMFSVNDLKHGVTNLGCRYQGVYTCSRMLSLAQDYNITKYPVVSEVHSAMSHLGVTPTPIGCLDPPLAGGTMKTKVTRSMIYDDVFPLTTKWCRSNEPYWVLPNFKGKMIDGIWVSPYTNAFVTENRCVPNMKVAWLALADFLCGMDKLDNSGYRQCSEEEALSGIPGTALHSFNVRTSVGPPYNKSKTNFMLLKPGESYMHEDLWGVVDEIDEVLSHDDIPATIGLCIPKDEALRVGKICRLFTNLPFPTNLVLKRDIGGVSCFIRHNMFFFECMVGINMTSLEANDLVRFLQRVDPTLKVVSEGDVRAMDKSWNGLIFDFVGCIFYAIAWYIGTSPNKVENEILGLKHCRFVIKNDIFLAFWNSSGNWKTVELNGFALSFGERYIYYLRRHDLFTEDEVAAYMCRFYESPIWSDERFVFRKNNALVTYGDDNLKTSRDPPDPKYGEIWRTHLGFIMTNGAKTEEVITAPIEDTSFLKRTLVFDSELNAYLPRLSLKSMSRTLLMKKESSLSMPDHAATAISEVLRELVYYGPEMYERTRAFLDSVAAKHGLLRNSHYVSHDYGYWRQKLKEGTFSAWSFDDVEKSVNLEWETVPHSGRMHWVKTPLFET